MPSGWPMFDLLFDLLPPKLQWGCLALTIGVPMVLLGCYGIYWLGTQLR